MNCPKSQLKDTEVRAEGMPVTYKQLLWERRPRDWVQDNQEVISQTLPAAWCECADEGNVKRSSIPWSDRHQTTIPREKDRNTSTGASAQNAIP